MNGQHAEDHRYDWGRQAGMQFAITRSTEHTSGELLELTQWLAPMMAGPPVHAHPTAEEAFEVTEGEIEVFVDGRWSRFAKGETAIVPMGAPHSVRNARPEPAKVVNIHRPARRMEAFFVQGATLVNEGKIKDFPPKDPRSATYAAMLFTKYGDDVRVVSPQRQVFRALSLIGRALGCKV